MFQGIILGNLIATAVVIINSLPGSYYHSKSTKYNLLHSFWVVNSTQLASLSSVEQYGACGDHNSLSGIVSFYPLVSLPTRRTTT